MKFRLVENKNRGLLNEPSINLIHEQLKKINLLKSNEFTPT